jgi:hypothetical protein
VHVLLRNPVRQSDLIKAADRSPRWKRAFGDDNSAVFVRATDEESTQ